MRCAVFLGRRSPQYPRVVQATLLKTVGERDQPALAKSSVPSPMIASPIVRVRNLSKSFGGLQAVKDVSFDLHPGEIVALIGPNGAGKSTIFNLMTGAIRPDQGEVTLHGQSLAGADPCAVARSGMARYFQHVPHFARSFRPQQRCDRRSSSSWREPGYDISCAYAGS